MKWIVEVDKYTEQYNQMDEIFRLLESEFNRVKDLLDFWTRENVHGKHRRELLTDLGVSKLGVKHKNPEFFVRALQAFVSDCIGFGLNCPHLCEVAKLMQYEM